MFKLISLTLIFFIHAGAFGQNLLKLVPTNAEKKKGVIDKYKYEAKDSYGVITLTLFSKGVFKYQMKTFNKDLVSKGKWKSSKGILTLNSDLRKDDIKIDVTYSDDTSARIGSCRFNIVKTLKGEEITDASVAINNDGIRCLPSYGSCYGSYVSIDSIKLFFENGMSSKWIKITDRSYSQINLTVRMGILPLFYHPIKNEKYRILEKMLKPM